MVPKRQMRLAVLGILEISIAVLIIYHPAVSVGFVEDDWGFLGSLLRSSFADYFRESFDPQVQFIFYRPMHKMLWWIEFMAFGTNPVGYHLTWVVLHAVNSILFYALTKRATHSLRIALISALVYLGLPLFSEAIFWPADAQVEATFFLLTACWLWWNYLETRARRDYWIALLFVLLGMLTKETNLILPPVLFLMDRFLVQGTVSVKELVRRYSPLVLFIFFYLGLSYRTWTYGLFPNQLGYRPGQHIASNLAAYLVYAVFPWANIAPWSYAMLGFVLLAGLWLAKRKASRPSVFLMLSSFVIISPVLPLPAVNPRYMYVLGMISAFVFSWLLETARRALDSKVFSIFAPLSLSMLVVGSGWMAYDAAVDRAGYSLQRRIPFRNIAQRHPQFGNDTFLYFIDYPANYLSTMFYIRYGDRVSVSDIYTPRVADLAKHQKTVVVTVDQEEPHELTIEPKLVQRKEFSPPIKFEHKITLEGYELARTRNSQGALLVLILYWRTSVKMREDYTVFVHLMDANGRTIESVDSQPRNGNGRTSSWSPNELEPDGILIPLDSPTSSINDFTLEVGMYTLADLKRLTVLDDAGQPIGDRVVIGPVHIAD